MNRLLQIFDDLEENRSKTDSVLDQSGIVGKRITAGWVEFGAIDHTIIEKLQNEEEPRARLQGAEELHRLVDEILRKYYHIRRRHLPNFLEI